jgi:hypothetical protein
MNLSPTQTRVVPSDRRTLLKQLFGFGIGIAGAFQVGSASAARRGHSSPNLVGGGYVIVITEGRFPGEIETAISPAGGGRAILITNFASSDVEVEIIQPDSGPSTYLLRSSWSLRVPIDHPGTVRWRVWRIGDTPGDYRIIDFGS